MTEKSRRSARDKERMKPQDLHDLKELIEFLRQYQVAEFDLDRGDIKIRLKFNQPALSQAGLSDARCSGSTSRVCLSRAIRRSSHRQIAHGRHVLWFPVARCAVLRFSRRSHPEGPGHLHRRSDEAHERNRSGRVRRNR
jgi:hypothetical protein